MRCKIQMLGPIAILRLAGSLVDAGKRDAFVRELKAARAHDAEGLILDISDVDLINGAGLGLLLFAQDSWVKDGRVCLCGTNDRLKSIILICRLNDHFCTHRTLNEAVRCLFRGDDERPAA